MRRFELAEPQTLEEACALLSDDGDARALAGGTALLTLIKHGIFIPKTLVNLKKIGGMSGIDYDRQRGLRIGALTTIYDVESSPVVGQHYPWLAEACHVVANIRIRNMATIGGNLAHGDYQSDPPTMLVALEASVELMRRTGTRQMKLSEFLLGSYETALQPGELLSALVVPPPDSWRGTYIKFTTGSSEERPCAGIAALVRMEQGVCRDLRLVVGAVSPRPVRMHHAEEFARGKEITEAVLQTISAEASRVVEPIDDLRGTASYKRHLVGVLVRRALAAVIH
jgi:aerobic carbon-monoxide dehydrogenase medium subunit